MKKLVLVSIVLLCSLNSCIWYFYLRNENNSRFEKILNVDINLITPHIHELKAYENVTSLQNFEYLVTIFTSFVDNENSIKYDYRAFVQSNFLRMTNYACFRKKVKFIVFTNSPEYRALIERDYPDVVVKNTLLRGNFVTPMYKDLYQTAMKTTNSFFYMQVNACNLYDSSLVLTLETIKQAWMRGLMRQKILIYGQKYNSVVKEPIIDEKTFYSYFLKAKIFVDYSQDYTIVTKETIEWHLYWEILMGRLVSDSSIVDFGVHNEMETIDASKSIRLVHQAEVNTQRSSSDKENNDENDWDDRITSKRKDHYSTSCARYSTKIAASSHEVTVFDKKSSSFLNLSNSAENYFFMLHKYWIGFAKGETAQLNISSPSLVVVILAFNKPESLTRLMNSLRDTNYNGDRIDLVISLDIGYMGYYDLPTLIATKSFKWRHGRKRVVLKQNHRGQLYQWLEASSIVDEGDEHVQMLIVEDCVVLSPHWYRYYKAVLRYSERRSLQKQIAGWSLEAPISSQSSFTLPMFSTLYADKSSIVLSGIKRIRTFIPVRKTWSLFLEWFKSESDHIPHRFLYDTLITKLENRGKYSGWESGMWVTWFNHYLKVNSPEKMKIMYIFDDFGCLAMRIHTTLNVKWFHFNGWYSKNNEALESELGVQLKDFLFSNSSILLPEVVPVFQNGNYFV